MGSHEVDLIGCCFAQSRFYVRHQKWEKQTNKNSMNIIYPSCSSSIIHHDEKILFLISNS